MHVIFNSFFLSFVQNVSFSMVSRSRNRDNFAYHAACSVASNGLWFATMHTLVVSDLSPALAIPYMSGTVLGSLPDKWIYTGEYRRPHKGEFILINGKVRVSRGQEMACPIVVREPETD